MPFTDTAIKKAKPADIPVKLSDSKGMYLLVNSAGSKLWRWKYRLLGKEKVMSLGAYPDVSLSQARDGVEKRAKSWLQEMTPWRSALPTRWLVERLLKIPLRL